jgi:hypothetical protein
MFNTTAGYYTRGVCGNTRKSQNYTFNFDTWDAPRTGWQFEQRVAFESNRNLHGGITIDRGHPDQNSDVIVHVEMLSTHSSGIKDIKVTASNYELRLDHSGDESDVCTEVQITAYLRPNPRYKIDLLHIVADSFDIHFQSYPEWDMDMLRAASYRGNVMTTQTANNCLVARHIEVEAWKDGAIFGRFSPGESLVLSAEHGSVSAMLLPTLTAEPAHLRIVHVSSVSGDIAFYSNEMRPEKIYTHKTTISTDYGFVTLDMFLGAKTYIWNRHGKTIGWLNVLHASNPEVETEIDTSSRGGGQFIYVEDSSAPYQSHSSGCGSFKNILASHFNWMGHTSVTYDGKWWGTVGDYSKGGRGKVLVDGDVKPVEEEVNKYYRVVSYEGKSGKSLVRAFVGTQRGMGSIDLKFGCSGPTESHV